MARVIERERSIVPACDVDIYTFARIVEGTGDLETIGGYKLGPALTGRPGYDAVVEVARGHTSKPLIFDPQKWATDIPDTASKLLEPVKASGIDAVILFPQSGPVTEFEWIRAAQELGLGVIVGGEMTHPGYREGDEIGGKKDYVSIFREQLGMELPTGFIRRDAPDAIYEIAARMGITDFVVPGNKPTQIAHYKALIEGAGVEDPAFYSPGLVA
jgi:orotidine-5'-phosphate decarboxylase